MNFSPFLIFFIVFIPKVFPFSTLNTIPYSDHCNSFVPEATATDEIATRYPFLEPQTSHYTGGQNILDQDPPSQRSIHFSATKNLFKTNVVHTYKIQAWLRFFSSSIYRRPSNFTYVRTNYSKVGWKYRRPLVFFLDGFWSDSYWDIVIVCGGVVLAVIILLQQCFGGRFVFPKRFRESVEYEMVPVTSNE